MVQPRMPEELRRNGSNVFVRVEITVFADGHTEVQLLTSSGNSEFDRAIQEQAAKWPWEPAIQGGQPVTTKERRKLEFTVD